MATAYGLEAIKQLSKRGPVIIQYIEANAPMPWTVTLDVRTTVKLERGKEVLWTPHEHGYTLESTAHALLSQIEVEELAE